MSPPPPLDLAEEAKRGVEQARPDLEERRFAHEQRLSEQRLELEKAKLKFDSRFAARHLGTFVTGLVSLAAVIVSVAQVWIALSVKEKEIELAAFSQRMQREMTEAQQTRDWNMKTAEFVATHWNRIFSSDANAKRAMADLMLVVFPPRIGNPLFQRLNHTDPGDNAPWNEAERLSAKALFAGIDGQDQTDWLRSDKYVEQFYRQRDQGLYPAKVEGRVRDEIVELHAEWKPSTGLAAWQSYHGMSKEGFDLRHADFTNQGYSLESKTNFTDSSGNVQYLATWIRKQ